jgi:hypothetical protein
MAKGQACGKGTWCAGFSDRTITAEAEIAHPVDGNAVPGFGNGAPVRFGSNSNNNF